MSDLVTFVKHVQEVLRDSYRDPHWTPEEAQKYMEEFDVHRDRFEELATHLIQTVISPRLETVASYFVNGGMDEHPAPRRVCSWFTQCSRFPVTTKLEFVVEHDVGFEKLIVHMEIHMMPALVRFHEQDNLVLPIDVVDDRVVADWVEERLLEFLDNYLRIDGERGEFLEELVTDPVCGMRISRAEAAASGSFCGHPYYFCCEDCSQTFQADPMQYV